MAKWRLALSPALAALAAAIVSLPGLRLPFLSDDWAQIEATLAGVPCCTPFRDFRPVYMASLWFDRVLGGLDAARFHATNLLLIAGAAALVVLVVRRYTGDGRLALASGLIFAVHPQHVENAAWVAGRSDPLFCVPYLLAMLAYDRWRERRRGAPWLTLLLYELALAAKETAVTLPLVLLVIGRCDVRRRPGAAEWKRGLLPLVGLTLFHFLGLRTWFLGGAGRTLAEGLGARTILNGLGLAAGAIVPLQVDLLAHRALFWGATAVAMVAALLLLARVRSGSVPRIVWSSAALFASVALPYAVGFEGRYLFLPAAPAALFLAASIRSVRGALAGTLAGLLTLGWLAGQVTQWRCWGEAAVASRALVADLDRAAADPAVDEIVLANMPFQIRGASVAGDFRAALVVEGRRPVPVRTIAYFCYPRARVRTLPDGEEASVDRTPRAVRVRLRVLQAPFWHLVGLRPPPGEDHAVGDLGSMRIEPGGTIQVRITRPPGGGRSAYVWNEGSLETLFRPGSS